MSPDPESGKAARAQPIIDLIQDELEKIGLDRDVSRIKDLSWDDPMDRRLIREKFGDDGDGEAILPGFGETGHAENAREDCGDPHPFTCDSCFQVVEFGRTCGMSVCARCAPVWARDIGIRKSAKLRRVRIEKERSTPENVDQKRHHVVISPPPGWYYDLAKAGLTREEAQEVTRSVVKGILAELRLQAALGRHSFRGVNEDGSIKAEHDDRGRWKDRQFSGRDWFGDVREELAWKPHYHAIGIADWIRADELTAAVEEATGWVIHRISDDRGISLEDDGDVARALTYMTSHADIQVRDDANRSAIWEVGAFEGDPIRSTGRFSARPRDLEWADGVVRRLSFRILGLQSGTTDCGANIPAVDDPDELARKIIEELYPDDPEARSKIGTEAALYHVSEGNIDVDVSTSSGGGGEITVRSAFGLSAAAGSIELPSSDDPWHSGAWSTPDGVSFDPVDVGEQLVERDRDQDDDCGCGDSHAGDVQDDRDETCNGTLIPLEEARRRGLLDDPDLLRSAAHADEALEADREWDDELDPWRSSSPGKASPAIG